MDERKSNRVYGILQEVAALETADERDRYLDQACHDDSELRERVETLLCQRLEAEALSVAGLTQPFSQIAIGAVIGPYKLLEEIGEGGFGTVWAAEQRHPVKRRVALKLIKLGMDTRQVIARFEAERQTLALMDHPNIAKVLDAGATDDGRPYFVMELVHGIPITDYCDENRISTRQRLELFITVCRAIHHAHQKGIIHRDIKPSNVLVKLQDGSHIPKVIDFGIAKAAQQDLTDKTIYTHLHQFIGTPAYVSPEQAQMSRLDIDTRSDIYSLGVMFYELLTGHTPFDSKTLLARGLDEMRRIIRDEQPVKPSSRLTALENDELTDMARRRSTEPVKLMKTTRGDLDWIVMKCLEKSRSRRYESANGLAMDLTRHLQNEPIVARPPNTAYRFRKLVQRNKITFAAAGAVLAALVFGLGLSTSLFFEKSEAYNRAVLAEREQTRLRREEEKVRRHAQAMELIARQMAYGSDMKLAKHMVDENKLGQASQLLRRTRPLPGQVDLRGWEWRYLWQVCEPDEHFDLCSFDHAIHSLAFSHDGRWAAIGEWDAGGVSVWNLRTREQVQSWPSTESQSLVAFSPVASILAFSAITGEAGQKESRVVLWDLATDKSLIQLPLEGRCVGLTFAADGQSLVTAVAGRRGKISIWRIPSGEQVLERVLAIGSVDEAIPFAASHDLTLAAYALSRELFVMDLATGKELWHQRADDNNSFISMQFSHDGKMLASTAGYRDSDIVLWKARTGEEINRLKGHRRWVGGLAFWPDGKRLASASADQTLCIWDLSDVEDVPPPRRLGGHRQEVWRIALLSDGKTLMSGSNNGIVKLWDSTSIRASNEHIVIPADCHSWWIAADGRSLITLSSSGAVVEILGPEFQHKRTWLNVDTRVFGADFRETGNDQRLAILTPDGSVHVWDLRRRERLHTVDIGSGRLLGFADEFKRVLIVHPSRNSIEDWDLSTGKHLRTWQRPLSRDANLDDSFDVSPDQRLCASVRFGGELLLCDLLTGKEIRKDLDITQVHQIRFSADSKILALVNGLGSAKLLEVPALREIATLHVSDGANFGMSFSPDGRRLALTTNDGLKLWDLSSRQELLELDCDFSSQCGFSPDGNFIVARTWRGDLHVWRAPTWAEIERIP